MSHALTRFGLLCRDLRSSRRLSMADQAIALHCSVHFISAIETGKITACNDYVNKLANWLHLNEKEYNSLKKRSKASVINLQEQFSKSNQSTSMRLFRKVSKMDPSQIRNLRRKITGEERNDRRFF